MEVLLAVGMFRDGRTGDWGGLPISAGATTFWLVLGLLLVLVVLYRSMRKHLRRVDFNEDKDAGHGDAQQSDHTGERPN